MTSIFALNKLAQGSPSISQIKKARILKHTGDLIMDQVFSEEFDTETFNDARNVVESTVAFLLDLTETGCLIEALNDHSDALYAHSLGVSVYATLAARGLGWKSPAVLARVAMAGLLHDIGKKEIDPAILAKPRREMNVEEIRAYETHPRRGADILATIPAVPSDLLQVVLEHHERDTGTGYPSGLYRQKIQPIARLIGAVDEFCTLAIANADSSGMLPSEALARLISFRESGLDASVLGALKNALEARASTMPMQSGFRSGGR